MGGLKDRNLFSHNSGGWKSKVKLPVEVVSSEVYLLNLHTSALFLLFTMPSDYAGSKVAIGGEGRNGGSADCLPASPRRNTHHLCSHQMGQNNIQDWGLQRSQGVSGQ